MSAPARPLRILHIDDEPVNLLVLQHLLRELGHDPVGVASGEQALEMLAAESFDLILTDIRMPGISGVDLLAALQKRVGGADGIPVVAVTADVMSRSAAEYEKLGFAGALSKPLQLPQIDRVLRAATDAPRTREFVGAGFSTVGLLAR